MIHFLYFFTLFSFYVSRRLLKIKKDRIGAAVACLILVLIMGGQRDNPDYITYQQIFSGPFYSKDPGFGVIIQILKTLGFTVVNFRLGIALIGLFLMSITVFRLVDNRVLFYLIYGIYPFLYDVVQARNFLVMSILVFSVQFLIDPSFKHGRLYFIFAMLIAISIQKVAIAYVPFVLLTNTQILKSRKQMLYLGIPVIVFLAAERGFVINLVTSIATSSDLTELNNYSTLNTRYGWLFFWAEQIFAYLLIVYANKIEQSDQQIVALANESPIDAVKLKFVSFMLIVNTYSFVFLPLFILNQNYTRIIRNLIPLNIIAVLIVCSRHQGELYLTKKRVILMAGLAVYQLVLLYMLFQGYQASIVDTTLNNNWLW